MDEIITQQEETTTEPNIPEDSILVNTIAHMIGPSDDYAYFYKDLIIHINAAFSRLCQLGVGPSEPFRVSGPSEVWSDFLGTDGKMEDAKQFVYLSVKHDFDPPTGALMDALEKKIDKLEWLLGSVAEVGY